jgi:acetylornithine deacetylase/succinyl-diaminopimelate desuccinylase-like protein
MYQMLKGKLDGLKKDAVDFTKRLINEQSTSLNEGAVAGIVENEMTKLGFDKVFRDKAGNVAGIIYGRENAPSILLCSHMDTVAPGPAGAWNGNPCSAEVKDGKIFGLGAADCKGGIAAQVYAAKLLKRSLLPMNGNIVVACTAAEENGLSMGTRFLMEETLPELLIKPEFAILGEPTNLGLYYGHDGWMEFNINLESGNGFNIEDAANEAVKEINWDYSGRGPGEYDVDKPYFSDAAEGKHALIRVRNRLYNGEDEEKYVERMGRRVTTAIRPIGTMGINTAIRKEKQQMYTGRKTSATYVAKAWSTNPFDPMIERARQALYAAGCDVKPGRWELGKLGMGTAGGVLLNDFKIATIGFGPGREEEAHAANEYVEIDKLIEAIFGTAVIVHGIAGVPVCGWTVDEI